MALSQARLAANRANAKKSTGPKTEAGKARSRANAFRHGLSASVLGRDDALLPVIGALHPPDPGDIACLIWQGATPDDRLLVAKVAAMMAQERALIAREATCLDQLETYCAMQLAMASVEPETMARLGTRVDITFTLMRRGYFGFPPPKIIGRPWRPRQSRKDALSGLVLVQRYARALHRKIAPLLAELDRRRLLAVGGWGCGTGLHPDAIQRHPATVTRTDWTAIADAWHAWDSDSLDATSTRRSRRLDRAKGLARSAKSLPVGSPEAVALVSAIVADIDTLVAKRTQALGGDGPGFREEFSPDRPDTTVGIGPNHDPAALPRAPPALGDDGVFIMPGHGGVRWQPGPDGFAPAHARGDAGGLAQSGPLAAGRLTHEPRPHGVGPGDPLQPLIPPQPYVDTRMQEMIPIANPYPAISWWKRVGPR